MQLLYKKVLEYSTHPHAFWILLLISFTESFIFPFPPDLLMMLMIISNRKDAFKLAFWCTVVSVAGGVIGYYIGYALYQTAGLWIIETYGYQEQALKFQELAKAWGFWIIALKAATPIPFKVVTILSGAASLSFPIFLSASLIARGSRFFIFAGLIWYFGPSMKDFIERRMGLVFALMMGMIIFGFWLIKVFL